MQVPFYKGKDTCTLDPNNYRGIKLLSVYNKLIEILIWHRLEYWCETNKVISDLQGACRKGLSCVHSALILRKTVATSLESNQKCFVAFFDVAKAFDTVWVDGLFYQLYQLGIRGKTWRILYRFYIGFRCCVRVYGLHSEYYDLRCRIHQEGYMSLIKYTVFINSLIAILNTLVTAAQYIGRKVCPWATQTTLPPAPVLRKVWIMSYSWLRTTGVLGDIILTQRRAEF